MKPTNQTTKKEKQLIALIIVLLVPCLFAFVKSEPAMVEKNKKLTQALANIDGYKVVGFSPLEDNIYQFLDLDDYTYTVYEKDNARISLYIGFYHTAHKVSAAHSPLVCFPGQGWTVSEPENGRLTVGKHLINYAQIDASLSTQKELIVYWYQAHDDTTPHVFRNKINTFYSKMVNDNEQHAFVRISIPLNNINPERAKQAIADFMSSFYPRFIAFINS